SLRLLSTLLLLSHLSFFSNDTATTEIYTLSLHDALPISFVSLGYGRQELELKSKLPGNRPLEDNFRSIGAGVNWYIGFNFVLRGEYRTLDIFSDNQTVSNDLWRLGFSSFFIFI